MSNTTEKITVMQAFEDGKVIEYIGPTTGHYWVKCPNPRWDFAANQYRIKAEPRKPREIWIVFDPSMTPRMHAYNQRQAVGNGAECIKFLEVIENE